MARVHQLDPARTDGRPSDDERLAEQLDRWLAASIITPPQADAIRALERGEVPGGPRPRIPMVVEAVGFLGGALAAAAGVVAAARFWDELSTGSRLAAVGATGAVLAAAGRLVRDRDEPALEHLGSFLWTLAAACAGLAAGLVTGDVLDRRGPDVVLGVGMAVTVVGAAFWAWRPAPLQHLSTVAGVALTVGGLAGRVEHVGGRFVGLGLWALGAVWILLVRRGRVRPAALGDALGAALAVVGGQILAGDELGAGEDVLAVVTAVALLGASVWAASTALLWGGVAGVFVSVPAAVARHFGDTAAAPVALLVAGTTLIGTAVGAARLLGTVRASRGTGHAHAGIRGRAVTLAAGAAVVVTVAVVALLTPFRAVPAFTSLSQSPDRAIGGTVAYVRGVGAGRCVAVVAAGGGTPRQVACAAELGFVPDGVLWNAAGNLVVETWREPGLRTVEVSPATGAIVSRGLFQELEKLRAGAARRVDDGAVLAVESDKPGRPRLVLETATGERRTVFEAEGPIDYRFNDALWSPDGRHALVQDTERRLLVVDVGAARPAARVLATEATAPAWGPFELGG